MKKVTVDLMLGRRSRSHFRKIVLKSMVVAAQMPAVKAIKTSSYGLRFGKTGLNAEQICGIFNTMSDVLWKENLLLPVVLFVTSTKTYVIEIKYPTTYTLLTVILDLTSKVNFFLDLPKKKETLLRMFYKIALIKSKSLEKKTITQWISQITGCYNSCDIYNPWRRIKKKFNYKKKKK